MIKKLSPQQKRFGYEYMIDHSAKDAYVRAGYSKKGAQSGGSRLFNEPLMQTFIAELEDEIKERTGLDADLVRKNLIQDRKDARAKGAWSAVMKANELLGKMIGAFKDVHQIIVPDVPVEDAVTEMCTQNGVVHETARALIMQGVEALKIPYNPDNTDIPEPTQPDPEAIH